jgi:hypothetical protein
MKAKKIYKIAKSKFGVLIFPTPVDKKAMYLINAPTIEHAEIYKYLLDFGALKDPFIYPEHYQRIRIHTDAVTEIYDLKWSLFRLELLPLRELDLARAIILENLLSRKFEKLFLNMDKKKELIKDIQFRFSKQLECSECQKLGIENLELIAFFNNLDQCVS